MTIVSAPLTYDCSVLGNPGSGCSTFLRTIGNDHGSFLGVQGSIDYSGLSAQEISKHYRGLVTYVPEEDVHLPTLTVRQTLDFALQNKTPKRWLHQTPRFIEEFAKAFSMTHTMDTPVGNEFHRGVSGGERKRVSILESLASDASVTAWDGSTRGLDSSSALDFVRSLRIMTNACQRATLVSLYQASDEIYNLMDKVLLIDEGRMLYQGPVRDAEAYFESLGYKRLPRQTMSDFLTSIATGSEANMRSDDDGKIPFGAENLERAFRASQAFRDVQDDVRDYETEQSSTPGDESPGETFKQQAEESKSRFARAKSSYNISFFRQVCLCAKRTFWQMQGHKADLVTRLVSNILCAFLLASMFYNLPNDTSGVYSRGGLLFYSSITIAWFQMVELDTAFQDRAVVSRQKRYAMVRPSAVVIGKAVMDVPMVFVQAVLFALITYFLSGMRADVSVLLSTHTHSLSLLR